MKLFRQLGAALGGVVTSSLHTKTYRSFFIACAVLALFSITINPSYAATTNVVVVASEDAYAGDALMALDINGAQVAQTTITALQNNGKWQSVSFAVTLPTNFQTIGVSFLNDAYGGSATKDRNLYVQSITLNGVTLPPPYTELATFGTFTWQASQFGLTAPAACGTTPSGSTVTNQVSQTSGSGTASATQCPYGGTQATTITVKQTYLCTNGTLSASGSPVSTTTSTGNPTCKAAAACGTTPSGSTVTQQISQTTGSIPATASQCAYGGTQPTTTTVTQVYLCTNGTLSATGSQISTVADTGIPSCKAAPINGVCGGSNGTALSSTPTANLCSSGTASPTGGTGPWNWTCTGSNGGSTATCSALHTASASGTAIPPATQIFDSAGSAWIVSGGVIYMNGALAGRSSNVTLLLYYNKVIYQENNTGGWWSWNGSGWTTASGDPRPANGSCGAANATSALSAPTANLCAIGTASLLTGSGPWSWNCAGVNGGASASCSAKLMVNGSCGASNGTFTPSIPTTSLCSAGTTSVVAGSGPWTWACAGINGGVTASCAAHPTITTNGSSFPYVAPLTAIPAPKAGGNVWYIDAVNGSDTNNGLTPATAFKSIDKGTQRWLNLNFHGGDVVVIMPGTYYATIRLQVDGQGNSLAGTPTNYTTIMGYPGQPRPIIIGNQPYECEAAPGSAAIQIDVPYVRISGLDVSAPGDGFSAFPSEEQQALGIQAKPGLGGCTNTESPTQFYGAAINFLGSKPQGSAPYFTGLHHLIVDNSILHDSGGGGFGSSFADYITLQGNVVYNNANWAVNETSGISIGLSLNYDTAPGYHSSVIDNIVYNNQLLLTTMTTPPVVAAVGPPVVPVVCPTGTGPGYSGLNSQGQGGCNTDGNGIIIDSNDSSIYAPSGSGYVGATLIYGNISYDNGGAGIEAVKSSNVDVINNTVYHNGKDIYLSGSLSAANATEISFALGANQHAFNNILVPINASHQILWTYNSTNSLWRYNVAATGMVFIDGSDTVIDSTNISGAESANKDNTEDTSFSGVNPLFVNPPSGSVSDADANFSLLSNSPAIHAGAPLPFATIAFTQTGGSSSSSGAPNAGAYPH